MARFVLYDQYRRGRGFFARLSLVLVAVCMVIVLGLLGIVGSYAYYLRPAGSSTTKQLFVIGTGASVDSIADNLKTDGLIRSPTIFRRYVSLHREGSRIQAGTYKFSPSQSVPSIVDAMVHGKVDTDLMTILPAQRIDQVRDELIHAKFSVAAVDAALQPSQYASMPLLADKPTGASLEGYLYPDSYSRAGVTDPTDVVRQALNAMDTHLTPAIRAGFAAHGLNMYEAITMASIIEKEVSTPSDRAQVAQAIYKRLATGMNIQSDVTAFYGAYHDGREPSINYDSPWNTYKVKGLPYGPISNVSDGTLQAVAQPAATDWLYWVAGDDGTTYFSKTAEEHLQQVKAHCHKLCAD